MVELARKVALDLLRAGIEKLDYGAPSIERYGCSFHRLEPNKGSVITLLGIVAFIRSRYRCSRQKNSIRPVDEKLGLLAGNVTRPAGNLAMRLVSELPLRHCQEFLEEAGGGCRHRLRPCNGSCKIPTGPDKPLRRKC